MSGCLGRPRAGCEEAALWGQTALSMTGILCEAAVERPLHQSVSWARLVAKGLVLEPGCRVQIPTLLLPGWVTLGEKCNLSVPSFVEQDTLQYSSQWDW